jgi:mannose/fructose-specific phosphotransferase system component IIA
MSEAVRGLVVSHASLAQGLVQSVRQIAGAGEEALVAVSNDACGPEALQNAVREALGEGPGIVFTDMPSGSCAFAARRLTVDRPETAVICGVNLPMLLDFVFHRDLPLPELVDRLVNKGKASITGACREPAGAHADRAASR